MSARVLALLLVLLPAAMFAQNTSSSVKTLILDPSGAAVPGAACMLTNPSTGAVSNATSAADGAVAFLNIPPGTYTLTVKAPGFKTLEAQRIIVTASEIRTLGSMTLEVGEVRESVSVTAEVAAVQLASAEKSTTITEQQLTDIAVKGRDMFALVTMVPGVVDFNISKVRDTPDAGSQGGITINGGRETQKNFTVDGVPNSDIGGYGGSNFTPNMDSISEVKVLTSNYQAEFGRNIGGTITVITKSGTNQLHGTAYDFFRHEGLNANNFFNNRTGTPLPPYRYRITGYSVGGPAYIPKKFNQTKDKLFFFFSQEYLGTRKDYGTQLFKTPTEMERQGNFSATFDVNNKLVPIKDPTTGQPFSGNIIPPERLSKLGQSILSFQPLPNFTDPDPQNLNRRNHRAVRTGSKPNRQEVIRVDANFWQTFQASWRFVNDWGKEDQPFNGSNWYLTPIHNTRIGRGHAVQMRKTFSPTLINETIFGKTGNTVKYDVSDKAAPDRSRMGNPPQWFKDPSSTANYIPNIAFGGGEPAYPIMTGLPNVPYVSTNSVYSLTDNLSKVWRTHQLKIGFYVESGTKFQVGNGNYLGSFDFSRDTNNPFDSGHSFANAALGNFRSYSERSARLDGNWRMLNVEWYIQDNWRVTRRLTVDVGLRFYHVPPLLDTNNTMATFDPAYYKQPGAPTLYFPTLDASKRRVAMDPRTGTLAPATLIGLYVPGSGDPANGMKVGGKDGYPAGLYTTPALAFGPRFGFAYDVFGTGRTAVRGGFGMFQDRIEGYPVLSTNGNPPLSYEPIMYYGNVDTYSQGSGVIGPPSNLVTLRGSNKLPSAMNYSFGVQHRIWSTTIDVAYVGSLGRHLMAYRNINPIPMYSRFDPKNLDSTTGKVLPDNFFRIYPGYGNITWGDFSNNSNYNALQIAANRRFTRGLQFGLAYTHSKALGVVTGDIQAVSPYFPARQWNYGPTNQDRPNVFVFNYIYDLPKLGARLNSKPLSWVADNWQVSGITSFITGMPLMVNILTTDGQDITGSIEGARVSVTGDPRLPKSERTFDRNLKTEMFVRTPKGSFGNGGIGQLNSPGTNNWNLALSKRIPLGSESRFIRFRAEAYNAPNHTQFTRINNNARFDPTGKQVDPTFSAYTNSALERILQLSLRISF